MVGTEKKGWSQDTSQAKLTGLGDQLAIGNEEGIQGIPTWGKDRALSFTPQGL